MADLVAEWSCVQRLFTVFDKTRSRTLNLDQLVDFVAEVRKMDIVPVDEAYIVGQLQQEELEEITFEQFKEWSQAGREPEDDAVEEQKDPFGNSNIVPSRFSDATQFVANTKVQHPCFTTTAHDLGIKKPQQVDMPVKWRGKEGAFTLDFCMNEPGNTSITINKYVNRGLRTNKTTSKVHTELDVDF